MSATAPLNRREYSSDIAFTSAVKTIQDRKGSRQSYARMERSGSWPTTVTEDLAQFLAELDMFYLGTTNAEGQPYIQYRGGSPGFLKVIDEKTLGFADFGGNRQYITLGNLSENPKVHLFLIDYARRARVKIWGTACAVEDEGLLAELSHPGYDARPERAIVVDVVAWDANCPQHIPQRLEAADVARALADRDETIARLEGELRALRAR